MPSPNAAAGSNERTLSTPANRAVPTYSRPRDGRQVTGTAVDRQVPPYGGGITNIYYPYYYPYGYGSYWWPGYGFGLSYYYDPFWYDPFYSFSGGYGYQGYGYSSRTYRDQGSLRLRIKPRDAQVFIDGYYVGLVDSFDGIFQRLSLDSGGHRVEIRAEGFEQLQFEVLVTPGETVTYQGELKRIQ
jgi:hypothetical protein